MCMLWNDAPAINAIFYTLSVTTYSVSANKRANIEMALGKTIRQAGVSTFRPDMVSFLVSITIAPIVTVEEGLTARLS
jgi:hypothetical protein